MLKILKVIISLDEYQCENEKKINCNNQIRFLTYAKIINFLYIFVNCQTKTVSSMITKDT